MTNAPDTTAAQETTPDVPEEHVHQSVAWRLAYQHAADHKNTPKACALYADTHELDFGGAEPVDALQGRIDELQAELDALPE
jgi:hypothetical protein